MKAGERQKQADLRQLTPDTITWSVIERAGHLFHLLGLNFTGNRKIRRVSCRCVAARPGFGTIGHPLTPHHFSRRYSRHSKVEWSTKVEAFLDDAIQKCLSIVLVVSWTRAYLDRPFTSLEASS